MGIIATTNTGQLNVIPDCYIRAQGLYVYMYSLPSITDSKGANYNSEEGMGRTMPFKTFSAGTARSIKWKFTLVSYDADSIYRNISYLRILEACVYPRRDPANIIPYIPPVVLSIKCGDLLANNGVELNVVMLSYTTSFPTDQVWNTDYPFGRYLPMKLDIDLDFDVVYDSRYLPGAERILQLGA